LSVDNRLQLSENKLHKFRRAGLFSRLRKNCDHLLVYLSENFKTCLKSFAGERWKFFSCDIFHPDAGSEDLKMKTVFPRCCCTLADLDGTFKLGSF